jgi:Flp pilus assembly protein TadB
MTNRSPGPLDRGRESMWRNLLIGEVIVFIIVLAIFLTDYSPVVWLVLAIVVVTTPLVVIGLQRARRRQGR